MLIVANGTTLADRLQEGEVILSDPEPFSPITDNENFARYLETRAQEDGAYLVDSIHNRITRVPEFNNNPNIPGLERHIDLFQFIPHDFLSYAGDVPLSKIGTKTRLAIRMPQFYENTETFQIKRSSYTPLGMGKVTHFTKEGLVEEIFFRYDPNSQGPFIEPEQKILAIYRQYERNENSELVRVTPVELLDKEAIEARQRNPAILLGDLTHSSVF